MSYYFLLQFRRFNRLVREFGLMPVLAYPLLLVLFLLGSALIFIKSPEYATWIYLVIALVFIESIGQRGATHVSKTLFTKPLFYQIRLIENTACAIPFVIILLYHNAFSQCMILSLAAVALAFSSRTGIIKKELPTPFRRSPHEFTVGCRKAVLYLPLIAYILVQAVLVNNANLVLFVLAFVFFLCISFYFSVEHLSFVWIHNKSPEDFLRAKIRQGLINATILTLPILILLFIRFPQTWPAICLIQGVGYLFIIAMIAAKYSAFPTVINLPHIILFMICLWLPPMLLIVIPLFYRKALNKLETILL